MSIQDDTRLLRECSGGAHERLVYVIPKHMARATQDLDSAWIMSQVVFWQQYNMANHGTVWVVKPAKEWQSEFGMTRRKFDTAIESLVRFGLQKKVIKSPYHNNNTALCLRFDPQTLYETLLDYINESFLIAQNEHSSTSKMSNPLFTEGTTENKKTLSNYVGVGFENQDQPSKSAIPPKSSHSEKKNTTKDTPTQTPIIPPTPRPPTASNDTHDSSHDTPPTDYQRFRRFIGKTFFGIADAFATNERENGRLAQLTGYLWTDEAQPHYDIYTEDKADRANRLIKQITAFVDWYKAKYKDAQLPKHYDKLEVHWLAFLSSRIPTVTYTIVDDQTPVLDSNVGAGSDDTMGKVDFRDVLRLIEGGE